MLRFRVLLGALALAVSAASSATALAAFPGANGQIAIEWTAQYHGHLPYGDLAVLPGEGGAPARVAGTPADAPGKRYVTEFREPAWSPDGTRLAYARFYQNCGFSSCDGPDSAPHYDVVVGAADGSGGTVVANDASEPAWSPDGTKLAVRLLSSGNPSGWKGVAIVDLATRTVLEEVAGATEPSWSPDGTELAFVFAANNGTDSVWRMRLADRSWHEVGPTADGDVDWSPDGGRLAYVQTTDAGDRVVTVSRDGGPVMPVSPLEGHGQINGVSWSPDGTQIAYSRYVETNAGSETLYNYLVFSVPAGGGAETQLTPTPQSSAMDYFLSPAWQPIPGSATPGPPAGDTTTSTPPGQGAGGPAALVTVASDSSRRPAKVTAVARAGRFTRVRERHGALRVPCRMAGDPTARCRVRVSYHGLTVARGTSPKGGAHQVVVARLTSVGRRLLARHQRLSAHFTFTPVSAGGR